MWQRHVRLLRVCARCLMSCGLCDSTAARTVVRLCYYCCTPHVGSRAAACLSAGVSFTKTCRHPQMASVVVREVETLQAAHGVRHASFAVPTDDQAAAQEPEWRPPAPPAVVLVDVTGGEWRTLAIENNIEAVRILYNLTA
jgi:hypothetical protein